MEEARAWMGQQKAVFFVAECLWWWWRFVSRGWKAECSDYELHI
jgi:hypothetical protein